MATGKITKTSVDAIKPGARDQYLWDEDLKGFGLRVTVKGARSYVYQYRLGGREAKTRRVTIGGHGSPYTPTTAREEAKRLALMVGRGIDPIDAEKERRRQAVDLSFSAYVETFAEGYLKGRWKRWEEKKRLLLREPAAVLGNKALPLITRADLSGIWDRLRDRPGAAQYTHATLRKLFAWAVERGDIERSPMDGVKAPSAIATRDRVLSEREVRWAWQAAEKLGAPFAGLYQLLIATGQRREEVGGMEWRELDREARLWTLPGARAKNGETHFVPLNALAIAVIDKIGGGRKWPKRGLVFTTTGETPVSGFSRAKARLDAEMEKLARGEEVLPWRVHDIRRTVATGFQRLGVRFEVTEAVLNHVSGARSGIAGVYQRHDWKEEKRDALEAWAAHLSSSIG